MQIVEPSTTSFITGIPAIDTSVSYERTGSVSYTVDGQVFGGKIDMVWQGDARSSFSVSGSFGLTLLDLETHGDTILVIQGDQTERYLSGDPMSKVPFFVL